MLGRARKAVARLGEMINSLFDSVPAIYGYYRRSLIANESKRQAFDLRIAVAANDPVYGYLWRATLWRCIFTASALIFSLGQLGYAYFNGISFSFSAAVSIAAATIAAYFAYRTHTVAKDAIRYFRTSNEHFEAGTETVRSIVTRSGVLAFQDLQPSSEEAGLGFRTCFDGGYSQETGTRSEKFDNSITLSATSPIRFDEVDGESFNFFGKPHGGDDSKRIDQLRYLVAHVEQQGRKCLNDDKFGLSSKLQIPLRRVQIHRMGYYDGVATNEFFRSRLMKWPRGVPNPDTRIEVDAFTRHFPLADTADGFQLPALPLPNCGNQIGITTLAVTSDGAVLFFRQGKGQAIVEGQVVASGSGSVNYSDIASAVDPNDFASIIRFSMARELLEEAREKREKGLPINAGDDADPDKVRAISQQTLLTGFFRWVDRAGKPEFIGVTRLQEHSHQIIEDNHEVMAIGHGMMWPRIREMGHFLTIKDRWLPELMAKARTPTSLSALFCLNRLCEIAGYMGSDDPEKKKVFELTNSHLFPG